MGGGFVAASRGLGKLHAFLFFGSAAGDIWFGPGKFLNAGVLLDPLGLFLANCPLRCCLESCRQFMLQSLCFWNFGGGPWTGFLPDKTEERPLFGFSQDLAGVWLHLDLDFHWLYDWRRYRDRLHGCFILAANKRLVLRCHFVKPFVQLPLVGGGRLRLQIEKQWQE